MGHTGEYQSGTDARAANDNSGHFHRSAKGSKKLVAYRSTWRGIDLCSIDPGFDVDLYLSTDLRTLTEVWMGYTPMRRAKQDGRLTITGNRQLEANMKTWFGLNRFATEKRVA